MIIISSMAHHASSWMNLPLALLIFLFSGVVLGSSSAPAALDWRNNNGRSYVTSVKNQGVPGCDNSWAFAAVSVVESALLIFLFWGVVLGSSSAPAAFDWRNNNGTNYVTTVKHRGIGRCDNSWAFAAVSVVESALVINRGWPLGLDLSEQQILDCGSYPRDRYGCDNSTVDDALGFITLRGGLSTELGYSPYTGHNIAVCLVLSGSMVSTKGLTICYHLAVDGNEDKLAQALATHGPVAVTICYHPDLHWYRTTISMTLVGYGTQDGIPYWILKNSWGTLWGESGFLKLARGHNMCGIVSRPFNVLAFNQSIAPSLGSS